MAMFDATSQTVGLLTGAARIGMGADAAYALAHKVDENGQRWLIPGVQVLVIGKRFRVLKRELDAVLGPIEVGS